MRTTGSAVKLTYDDFVQFPDDGKRHELIGGEHYVTPSPNTRHQEISRRLHLLIGNRLGEHPVGYRRERERFRRPIESLKRAADVLTTPLLPGLEIPLTRVFR